MSTKFQVTLPVELASDMKFVAARLRIPLAQFIRDTMQERLQLEASKAVVTDDPFAGVTGLIDDESDLSSRVDEILYR